MNKNNLIIIALPALAFISFKSKTSIHFLFQNNNSFGYRDKGDSIEFIFGEQKMITVSGLEFVLDKRRDEIKQVNLAGEFNNWKPDNNKFILKKADSKLYKLVLSKDILGKKGTTRQFKFILNGQYWIEPPAEATNKITGKDGNTNLFIKL